MTLTDGAWRRATLAAALVCLLTAAVAMAALPRPQGRINDFADVLDDDAKATLKAIVDHAEHESKAEIAVVTVPSLEGRSIEEYAAALFQAWGIGKKGVDNGVLVLVCPPERKVRIEVGYGLEGVLPDGLAGSIIRQQITPAFRDGDYARGLIDGVRRIDEIVRAGQVLSADDLQRILDAEAAEATQDLPPTWLMTPFFGLFIGLGALAIGAGVRTKSPLTLVFGALFGGLPGLMALIPFFNVTLWVIGPLAAVMLAVGYAKGAKMMEGAVTAGGDRSSGWGSSLDSGGWVSSSSDSSSSSSDDSFGGGSSGGGGASGSW